MTITTQVPAIKFTSSGPQIPSDADILTGVQADQNTAFGGGVNPDLSTPQGQLAQSMTAIISDKNAQILEVINGIDPATNSGRWQDAIARIYFLSRSAGKGTVVTATVSGAVGTVLPAGGLAQDTSGYIYASTAEVTIGSTGSAQVQFQNQTVGAIACPAGALSRIYIAVTGWERITNADDGVLGAYVESRADFEYRRKNSVSINGKGTPQSIYAEVFSVDDVIDVYVKDNPTGAIVNTGATNYPIAPHSVYVAAAGGVDADIASAIFRKKDLGCDTNGNTSQTVIDDSGYSYPQPSYTIKFVRPVSTPVFFSVSLTNDPSLPSNIVQIVKDAIVARFNGTDGTTRERIGSNILASRYYGAIYAAAPNAAVLNVLVGTSANPASAKVSVGIDQYPTVSESGITVTLV